MGRGGLDRRLVAIAPRDELDRALDGRVICAGGRDRGDVEHGQIPGIIRRRPGLLRPARNPTASDNARHPKTIARGAPSSLVEQSGRQAVDADQVWLPPIAFEALLALGARPVVERGALAAIVEERRSVAAGGEHEVDGEADDLARAGRLDAAEGALKQLGIGSAGAPQNLAATVEAQDVRRPIEGAEHEREPAVRLEMGGGLVAAAGAVEISDSTLVDDRQGVRPARGNIHSCAGRGGRGEEDALAGDEVAMTGVKAGELFGHGALLVAGFPSRASSGPRLYER